MELDIYLNPLSHKTWRKLSTLFSHLKVDVLCSYQNAKQGNL